MLVERLGGLMRSAEVAAKQLLQLLQCEVVEV